MLKFKNVKIGAAPINWSNDDDPKLGGHISFEQCIQEMKQAGYVGTEVGNKYPKEPGALLQALAPYNLQVSSAWMSTYFTEEGRYQETLENFMHHLSFMKAVGADVINLCECGHCIQQSDHALFSGKKPTLTQKQWKLLINGLHELGRIAYDHGMKISYHYHLGTAVQNEDEIDYLMANTAPTLVGLLLDTGHAYAAGVDPVRLLDKYGQRINQVHLKDVRDGVLAEVKRDQLTFMQGVKQGIFTVPGDGNIDFDIIFDKLSQLNYQGWFVVEAEQDPNKAVPLDYATKAREFIKEKTGL
ncbi:myo-inosose-2 dehydratase [Facilibium subflavum]|uniref:myo-inosose-2 dehydratase n=1 Tax=Facilibium subflavum TaxID=2219058 RepID=UPI0013C2BFCC|nr:myo-inosose-2 dehydratase [Facilibium subflavum]